MMVTLPANQEDPEMESMWQRAGGEQWIHLSQKQTNILKSLGCVTKYRY